MRGIADLMNRSRSVSETSVGLFAFLDVLMSTMGSLILVLMVVTPKIRQEAVAKAASAVQRSAEARRVREQGRAAKTTPAPYVPAPVIELPRETVDLNAKLEVQLAELSHEIKDRRQLADDKHEALGAEQARLQKNQAELAELEQRFEQILRAKSRLAESVTKVSSEGIAVESQLAGSAARLRTIHGEIAHAPTRYTFVAYDGVSGTTRHPILIECTRAHIEFLQEEVSLSSADVSGYSPSYNPLLAGAQALVDYWATHSAPGEPRPYVLLVVRPNGAVAYATARRLLERMKDPFGYELLPDDQKLEVPPPVSEAAEACRRAVEKAIAERVDVFKQVFGNGSGAGRGNNLGGSGPNPSGNARAQNGGATSPFDDLGVESSGGSKPAGQNTGNTSGGGQPGQPNGSNPQAGPNGTNVGSAIAQSQTGLPRTGSTQAGSLGDATSGPSAGPSASRSLKSGTPTPGTGMSGDRQAGVLLSDTGVLATGRTTGNPAGISMMGIGTPGTGSSAASAAGTGGTGTGSSGKGGTGMGGSGAGGSGAGGSGAGAFSGGSPGVGGPRADGTSTGSPSGSSGHSPGTGSSGTGVPGGDSPDSGFASTGGPEGTGAQGPAAAGSASQSEFPPSIIPRSGAAESSSLGTGSDRLTVGHPTPGVSGNETSDGQPQAPTGQSGELESGSFASGSQSGPHSGSQSGSTQFGSTESGSTQSGPAQADSEGLGQGQSQSAEFGASQGGANGQPESGQAGGSPSSGSASSSASGGDEGQSAAASDASPGARAVDGLPNFATSSDDDGGPRRANQQTTHRWGISSPRASIGFEHDLRVYIEAGRIFVGGQSPIACGRGESSDQLSFAVLRALDREARSWGRPRENFYWVPSLRIVICPGGVLQYERIQPALLRHGLSATVDFRLELSRPAPLPRLLTE